MQHFLDRLAWRNLPIQAKTAFLSILLLVFLGVMALASLLALDSVRNQMQNTVAVTVDMRLLVRSIQLEVESLQTLQTRLSQAYKHVDFDPATTSYAADYAKIRNNILAYNAQLLDLSAKLQTGADQAPFQTQVDLVTAKLNTVDQHFSDWFALIEQLSAGDMGAITQLVQAGDALEAETIDLGNIDMFNRMVALRKAEAVFLQSGSGDDYTALQQELTRYRGNYELVIPAESRSNEIRIQTDFYQQKVDYAFGRLKQAEGAATTFQTSLSDLRNEVSRLGNVTEEQVGTPLQIVSSALDQQRMTLLVALIVILSVSVLATTLFGRNVTGSVRVLLESARRFSSGNLNVRASVSGEDEFSQLGASFNAMAAQLEGLISGLEQRVAERTRDLSITGDIGHAVVAIREPRELMSQIVELIRHRFGFYHSQIFLVDNAGENAMLIASTGTAGRELLARGHALAVGSQSVIGQVTAQGEPVIASDTDTSAVHKRNELLPDTRSEMALPMRIGDRIIGALDVQSVAPNAFDQDDIAVFQIMADQLAVALENARLHGDLQNAQAQIEILESRIAAEAWLSYRQGRRADAPLAYEFEDDKVEPFTASSPMPMGQAIQTGHLVALDDGEEGISLAVPIRVRGEVIGAFGFGGETVRKLTDDDLALVEAVIDRVGLALENLRLMEQTTRRAEHEQIINTITAKIVGSTEVDQILQTTVKELGRVLRAPQTSVQLRREKLD
jgi:GAF domain-containing protein/HAMP domain-containing protein